MAHERSDRNLRMEKFTTRCLRSGEIHELLLCAPQESQRPRIDRVAYLGFGEICSGGVVEVGDRFSCHACTGHVLGFDETHYPNHYNVIIVAEPALCGERLDLRPGDEFWIEHTPRRP